MPSQTTNPSDNFPSFKRLSAHLSAHSKSILLSSHKQLVYSLAWAPSSSDGRHRLASASADCSTRIWNMGKSAFDCIAELKGGHKDGVNSVLWEPSSDRAERLATTSTDKLVLLWDTRAPKTPTATIETEGENINMSWSPDAKMIAVGNKEDTISFIDPRGGGDSKSEKTFITRVLKNDQIIHCTSWNFTGDLFFLTTGEGTVEILEYPTLNPAYTLQAHTSLCSSISFDPRGRHFATGGGDAITCIWDIETMLCRGTVSRLDSSIRNISFSYDGELLASGSEDAVIDITHVDSGEVVHSIKTSPGVQSLAFHPSKHVLAYACDEGRSMVGSFHVFNAFQK